MYGNRPLFLSQAPEDEVAVMPRLGKFCVTALVTLTTIVHLRNAHARQLQHTERIKDGSEYLATGGDVFSMRKIRTYAGPRLNDSSAPSALIRPDGEYCERWAVYVATVESTERVKQLGNMDEWCVVVVMDKAGEWFVYSLFWYVRLVHRSW